MKHIKTAITLCLCGLGLLEASGRVNETNNVADSLYLFSYATSDDEGRSGLRFAWSRNGDEWTSVGKGHSYLRCDYGLWGVDKKMIKPELRRSSDGTWHCLWQITTSGKEFAHAASPDLASWWRQTYFTEAQSAEVIDGSWTVPSRQTIVLNGKRESGSVHKVASREVDFIERFAQAAAYRSNLHNERCEQDGARFAGLQPVNMHITVRADKEKPISDKLVGVFFEDINYGADGGLYAELVQNRDFEYVKGEDGNRPDWGPSYAWRLEGEGASMTILTGDPIHPNNPHYAALDVSSVGAVLVNSGFDGIVVREGEKYDFNMFVRTAEIGGKLRVSLRSKDGETLASATLKANAGQWRKVSAQLTATASADDAVLAVEPLEPGRYSIDMVSLFPKNTFMGRKNGLRADLAQTIADIKPRFVRFPGGCVAHGQGLANLYHWKNTIGPLESRKPMNNLWGYHQTMGLGYFEYFQFCEDIGAEPLPVIAAAVPCQNSALIPGKLLGGGQQCGVPMDEMDEYIQDILDLIEYANGDPKTSQWARKRAEAGHEKPFNLKYIGIGNEDQITDVFEERFTMIYNAIKERHPEITVIGTVGPFYEGTDYEEGWDVADKLGVPVVDEHYYNPPAWFIYNQDFYDRYDRTKSKVYLGEYAAHLPNRANCIETALAEALYLTSVERNGDVVIMSSYAPLLAKEGHTQWSPDLIYFNNKEVKPTVGYQVQRLYGLNSGDSYVPTERSTDNGRFDVDSRIAISVVRCSKTGDVIIKMVNMLPVEVNTSVDVPMLNEPRTAKLTLLTGKPDDTEAKPTESQIEVGGVFDYTMPPYSFTIIRI